MSTPPTRHLPVFVYGTLRVGGRFHDRWLAGRFTSVGPATLDGGIMWDNHGAYPMLVLDPSAGAVTGELFEIDEAIFAQVLAGLDHLEGHVPEEDGNLYERVVVEVATDAGPVAAWIYVMAESEIPRLDAELPRIASGDWFER